MENDMTVRRAMQRGVRYLDHEREDYKLCSAALRGNHIWNSVRILQDELVRQQVQDARKKDEPVQGY